MKNLILLMLFIIISSSYSQTAREYYDIGMSYKLKYNEDKRDYTEAMKYFNKTIALDSSYYEAYFELAECYQSIKWDDEALAIYQNLLSLPKPDSVNIISCKIYYKMGIIYYQKANDHANSLLSLKKDYEYYKDEITQTELLAKQNYNLAINNFELSLIMYASYKNKINYFIKPTDLHWYIGQSYYGSYNFDKAINNYKLGIKFLEQEKSRSNEMLCLFYERLGDCFKIKRDDNKTIDSYKKALSYDSENVEVNQKLGDYYYYKNNYNMAIKYYKVALNGSHNKEKSIYLEEDNDEVKQYLLRENKYQISYLNFYIGLSNMQIKNYSAAVSSFIQAFNHSKTKNLKNRIILATAYLIMSNDGWFPCEDERGVPLEGSENTHFFYNVNKIKTKSQKIKQVWIKSVHIPQMNLTIEEYQKYENDDSIIETSTELASTRFKSELILYEFYCANDKYRRIQTVVYDENNNVVDSYTQDFEKVEWNNIVPNSVAEGLYQIICKIR